MPIRVIPFILLFPSESAIAVLNRILLFLIFFFVSSKCAVTGRGDLSTRPIGRGREAPLVLQ